MVTSKYKVSDLGLTSTVKFRRKVLMFVIQTNKDTNVCEICYATLALGSYISRDTIVEIFFLK